MAKDIHDPESVNGFIRNVEPEFASLIEAVRKLILATDKIIGEQLKWNSPSFFYTGAMKPFDPKEYKRDIAVLNCRKGVVLVVLPTGAKIKDSSGLLEGSYADGRRMVTFKSLNDVKSKGKALQAAIKQWLYLVEV